MQLTCTCCMLLSMAIAKVIRIENSQAVRIPRQFHLHSEEVEIFRHGGEIILRERPQNLAQVFELLTGLSPDFFKGGRRQSRPQNRSGPRHNWVE
jgi:antitoxin VapB